MFSVIFEVFPNKANWDDYLANAKVLRQLIELVLRMLLRKLEAKCSHK